MSQPIARNTGVLRVASCRASPFLSLSLQVISILVSLAIVLVVTTDGAKARGSALCRKDLVDAALAGQRGYEIDRAIFFNEIRKGPFPGFLYEGQVEGLDAILKYWDQHRELKDIRWLAYLLGTAFHETAKTFGPVRETLAKTDEQAYQRLRRHFGTVKAYFRKHPKTGFSYFGRGLVQLTWANNYIAMGKLLGVGLIFFLGPGKVMTLKWAVPIIFEGMIRGAYVPGHCLPRYFHDGSAQWTSARYIVNGTDKRKLIAGYGQTFLAALEKARVTPGTKSTVQPEELAEPETPVAETPVVETPVVETPAKETPVQEMPEVTRSDLKALSARIDGLEANLGKVPELTATVSNLRGNLRKLSSRLDGMEASVSEPPGELQTLYSDMLSSTEAAIKQQREILERLKELQADPTTPPAPSE